MGQQQEEQFDQLERRERVTWFHRLIHAVIPCPWKHKCERIEEARDRRSVLEEVLQRLDEQKREQEIGRN